MAKSFALQLNPQPEAPLQPSAAEERLARQIAELAGLDWLRILPEDELRVLAGLATLRVFGDDSLIIAEQNAGELLFLLLEGFARLTIHDKTGREVLLGLLGRGDVCGEAILFGDHFRRINVVAESACYVLQLPLADLRHHEEELPAMLGALRQRYRARLVDSTLGRVPLFSSLSAVERGGMARLLQRRRHPRGAAIVRQDEPGDALYLIEDGQVTVEQRDQVIAHLEEGDFFGEMSLLNRQPHNATVRALTPVDTLILPGESFHALLAQQPELAAQMRRAVDDRTRAGAQMRKDNLRAQQLDTAVRKGLLRGSHVLVRDTTLCEPNCRLCDQACTQRHGHSRFRLNGTTLDQYDVLDSCRQCRFGAECVEVCPEDALRWNNRGALFVTDSCTGCGECVPACPYDAIRLVPTGRAHDQSPLWRLWNGLRQRRTPIIPLEQLGATQHADKCDLCHGYDDLACVNACPTGALRLVAVEELLPL